MPLLIQTGLEKFQFNRSRPISEPVWNQFPSVVSLPSLLPRLPCREFMKRTILQKKKKEKRKKDRARREKGRARARGRGAIKPAAPPVHPPEEWGGQRDERDRTRSGGGRGMDRTRGSAGSDQLGEGNYLRSFDLELDLTGKEKNRERDNGERRDVEGVEAEREGEKKGRSWNEEV